MKSKPKIAIIAGARPNFMKVAPLLAELKKNKVTGFLINTGQHFSPSMAGLILKEFKIKPAYTLCPSRVDTSKQLNDIARDLEKIFIKEKPSLVIVVGDVNSTLVAAQVAKKLNIKIAHIEAGLRSYNIKMPEERNRIATDKLSDMLFATQSEAVKNLKKEGITKNVYLVGNIMIDTLKMFLKNSRKKKAKYYFCTLHRAENVDNKKNFLEIINALEVVSMDAKIYFPLHPRTKKMAQKFNLLVRLENIFHILPPLNYGQSITYQQNAKLILTDSGGVQEEASFLGVPCLTLRTETERPITVKKGTNTVAGITKKSILFAYKRKKLLKKKTSIPLWDGKTSTRIVKIINKHVY